MDQGLGCGVVYYFFGGGQDCEEWEDCSDAEDFGKGCADHKQEKQGELAPPPRGYMGPEAF